MQSSAEKTRNAGDEIDLFELAQSIWQEKLSVILVTVLITALAVAYALLAKPVYEATNTLLPPSASAIQPYNQGLIALKDDDGAWLTEHTTETVYDEFLKHLHSRQLRNQIMDEFYIPLLPADTDLTNHQALYQRFAKVLSIKQPDAKNMPDLHAVQVQFTDPEQAARLANDYVKLAVQQTKQQLKADVEAEHTRLRVDLESQLESLRNQAAQERKSELIKLQEALVIANELSIELPILPVGKNTLEGAAYVDRNLLYMRGAKALQAQINVLENRASDIPFIENYQELAAKLELLKTLKLDNNQVAVVTIDELAEVPVKPIKPKKLLIMVAGLLAGGFLGLLLALIKAAVKRRKLV